MTCNAIPAASVVSALLLAIPSVLHAQPPAAPAGAQEPVAALKQSLQQGQTLIRQYEWIETTIISLKGEEKSRMQKRCYYGADGKLTKVPMDKPAEEPQQAGRGGRGGRVAARVVENKKDEMKEYMEKAAGLIERTIHGVFGSLDEAEDERARAVRQLLEDVQLVRYAPQLGDYSEKLRELTARAGELLRRWA